MGPLGDIDICELLGTNPVAKVHHGYDHENRRDVAIMAIHDKFQSDPKKWTQIWDAILERIRLKHDYIASVYRSDSNRGWVVMEYLQGNLANELAKAPISADVVRTVMRRALQSLAYLHSEGAIHGNVKPATLMFDRKGETKLAFSPGLTLGGQVPSQGLDKKYVAPELMNADVGQGVDLYALGVSALELLMGSRFADLVEAADAADPQTAWLRWHMSSEDHVPVEQLVSTVPSDLANVINRLLRKKPQERYPSAQAALEDLQDTPDVRIKVPSSPNEVPAKEPVKEPVPATSHETDHSKSATSPRPDRRANANRPAYREEKTRAAGIFSQMTGKSRPPEDDSGTGQGNDEPNQGVDFKRVAIISSIVVVIGVFLMIFMEGGGAQKARPVTISSSPAGAGFELSRLLEDGREKVEVPKNRRKTPAELELVVGEYEIVLTAKDPNYGPLRTSFRVPEGEGAFPLKEFTLKKHPQQSSPPSTASQEAYFRLDPLPFSEADVTLRGIPVEAQGDGVYRVTVTQDQLAGDLNFEVADAEGASTKLELSASLLSSATSKKNALVVKWKTASGTLLVDSIPTNAAVHVFDRDNEAAGEVTAGETPAKIELGPGRYTLKIQKDYYVTHETDIEVFEGAAPEIKPILLREITKRVALSFTPSNAEKIQVSVDGIAAEATNPGTFAFELPLRYEEDETKTVSIRVEADGFEVETKPLLAADLLGADEPHEWKLIPLPTTLSSLPASLEAVGEEMEQTLNLPKRARSRKLSLALKEGSVPLEFVLVTPGEFDYGAVTPHFGELQRQRIEIIEPFYMAVHETTNAQYQAFFDEVGARIAGAAWKQAADKLGSDSSNHPVVSVSYQQAEAFCQWIAEGSRLPTEKEWERAARGADGRNFPGSEVSLESDVGREGRYNLLWEFDAVQTTCPVNSSFTPGSSNSGRFTHMLGNVAEWCQDLYLPGEEEDASTPGIGLRHVVRGCSYMTPVSRARLTWRSNYADDGGKFVGFRVLIPIERTPKKADAETAEQGETRSDSDTKESGSEKPTGPATVEPPPAPRV